VGDLISYYYSSNCEGVAEEHAFGVKAFCIFVDWAALLKRRVSEQD
jgi:hypothetical protein